MKRLSLLAAILFLSCSSANEDTGFVRIHDKIKMNNYVYQFRSQDHATLLNSMTIMGYQNLEGYSINHLRRIMIAYEYDALFWDMHEATGFPVSIFFSFFIFEATRDGIETDMWMKHWNPGGIKYKGKYNKVLKDDDCEGKCEFASMPNYAAAIDMWASVFNSSRYTNCRSEKTAADMCKCIKDAGYHTANSHVARARLTSDYWKYRRSFPTFTKN